MLTFRQLDDAGEAVVKIIAETEQAIISDMARRITHLGDITAATNWQAKRLEMIGTEQKTIVRELSRALNMSEQRLIDIFDEAATRTIASDDKLYRAAGYNPVPLAENQYLQQLIRSGLIKTEGAYQNLTLTTANTATKQFERALDLAYHEIISGGYTYQQAIRDGIRALTKNGLASVDYPSGHTDYMDVAFHRATLTGINQTAAEIQLANMTQLGTDLVETTAHPGARPSHAAWQGRVFSVSGASTKYPNFRSVTGYGTGPGLCGWNCRHSFFPYFEGLSDPAYSPEKLREYNNKTVKYNGEEFSLYDATQRQRYIERQIRRWKREASAMDAAGLDNGYARNNLREWQAAQRDFIKQTGLTRDYFRERAGKQNGAIYSNADIAKTLSGKAFRVGNPGKPAKTKAPDTVLRREVVDGNIIIPQGAAVTDVRVIAGRTTHTPLRDTPRLNAEHPGTDPTQWQKKVGTATVDGNPVYVHWYENGGTMCGEKVKPK